LGWGLNRHDDAEAAFAACHRALRAGGELVLGWNGVFPHSAVRPETIGALRSFARSGVEGIGGPSLRIRAPHRHVFEFYRKRTVLPSHVNEWMQRLERSKFFLGGTVHASREVVESAPAGVTLAFGGLPEDQRRITC
jgi:hypothetical protein